MSTRFGMMCTVAGIVVRSRNMSCLEIVAFAGLKKIHEMKEAVVQLDTVVLHCVTSEFGTWLFILLKE